MIQTITSGQADKFKEMSSAVTGGVVEAMSRKGQLTRAAAQRVIRLHNDMFEQIVGDAVREALMRLSVSQVTSRYGYMSGYCTPKPIAEQIAILQEHFPEFKSCDEQIASMPVPAGAEGYFAILRWQGLGKTYGEAFKRVLDVLDRTRSGKFINCCKDRLGSDRLRESVKKAQAMKRIASAQEDNDILVIAAQFGIRHQGCSVCRARVVMEATEFGMGAFEVAIMLLTHPERLAHRYDLWIDCAGDEYSWNADGRFDLAPYFRFHGGGLKFDADYVDYVFDFYGSASGLLQC